MFIRFSFAFWRRIEGEALALFWRIVIFFPTTGNNDRWVQFPTVILFLWIVFISLIYILEIATPLPMQGKQHQRQLHQVDLPTVVLIATMFRMVLAGGAKAS